VHSTVATDTVMLWLVQVKNGLPPTQLSAVE
jgi:hypothetical protein